MSYNGVNRKEDIEMNLINDIVLNLILIIFPILIYFIYNCYRELKCEKYSNILFNIALFTSWYLVLKYGRSGDVSRIILFCNIPILIAYLKRQMMMGVVLSILSLCYIKGSNYFVVLMGIKFICFFIIYILALRKNISDNKFIIVISIIQGFFISFEYFYYLKINSIITLVELLIVMFVFYIVPFIILYLFKLADNISNLYQGVSDIEREKQIINSLFKITHEVKNPIAVCKGYLEMIDTKNDKVMKRYVSVIKQEIDRSLDIMNDFMEFSKIKINKDILDINMLMEEVYECVRILLINRSIDLIYNINDDEVYVEGDYNRLKQVFINILKNSLEAIEGNGKIEIRGYEDVSSYYIEIIDNGKGIDSDNLEKIGEMFYTTKKNGTGLGVCLSNEIIKVHGGSLKYDSKYGEYTKVIVKLPKYVL